MKIESYEVNMQASSSLVQKYERNTELSSYEQNSEENNIKNDAIFIEPKKLVLSSEDDLAPEDKIKKRIIEILLGQLTNNNNIKLYPNDNIETNQSNQNAAFSYKSKEEYYEKTTLDFSAEATIKTSNGEFKIDLNLSYSQEFYMRNETSINASGKDAKNLFSVDFINENIDFKNIRKEMSFEFDYNKNPNNDVETLQNGVSYLALDKNSNGEIDDGGELFGVNSGDGFAELSAYDEDGNNWIDENDSVFKDLRVWEKNQNGESTLVSLADSGIGAIYLANVSSVDSQSSIFLKENGEAGVISSVDIRV